MKIFHTTDPHGKWGHIRTTVEAATPDSLIAISGDIHNWEEQAGVPELKDNVSKLQSFARSAAKKGCHLAVCSGNHDDWATPSFYINWLALSGAHLHGDLTSKRIQIGEEKIWLTCFPWRDYESPRLLDPTGGIDKKRWRKDLYSTEVIEKKLEETQKKRAKEPWVWLHHNPPAFTETSGGEDASIILRTWIQKYCPTAVLSGHVHLAFLKEKGATHGFLGETLLSNPGRNRSEIRYNEIDLTTKSVETKIIPIPTEPRERQGLPICLGGIKLEQSEDYPSIWIPKK